MKINFFAIFLIGTSFAEPQLQSVNVVFRHGDRAPSPREKFPNDLHFNSSFYPYGRGGLTNDGKAQVYRLGQFLRKRYRDFLGDVYMPNLLYARTTDNDRTKMCLQVVLAALFPPSAMQKWHETLDWQPIPYTSVPWQQDDILAVVSQPSFLEEKIRVSKTMFIRNRFKELQAFISQLEKLTGNTIKNSFDIVTIYNTLYCQWKLNLTLPSWSEGIFSTGKLLDAALIDCEVMTYDKNVTYQLAGKLAAKIKGDILEATNRITSSTKLFLYSGHEVNVVGILASLQVYHKYHIPELASAAIIELLEENDKYYVKVLYYHGQSTKLEELRLPGCSIVCPLEKYLDIVNDFLH